MLNFRLEMANQKRPLVSCEFRPAAFLAGLFAITLALLTYASPGHAHRQHLSWTTIEWNAQASVLEITHRVHAHDASAWLAEQTKVPLDITDIEHQAKFALYCAEQFHLQKDQQWQELELLGAEIKGNFLLTYQQLPLTSAPVSLFFKTTILMDLFSDQEHVVNINSANGTKSLSFDLQHTYQGIQL